MTTLHTVAATGALKLSWLLLAFPLFGAAVLLLGGRRTNRWGHLLGVAMPVAAFVYGLIAFFPLLGDPHRSPDQHLHPFIHVARATMPMGLQLDPVQAIFLMFSEFGTVTFTGVFGAVGSGGSGVATALGLLLLLGACGKSAQVPLQSWLLDAMEGPTPVSALIHAATMVTAGVYLLVRSNPILALSPTARLAITVVGAVTLLWGAIIGCAKDDIKKALAGSTMSQIGYMILGAGLGPAGYVFAIAHLLAHGFFKAGLFLGAGSVMHEIGRASCRDRGAGRVG